MRRVLDAGARHVATVQAETLELARAWATDPKRYEGDHGERLERLDALCRSIFRMLGAEQAQQAAEKRNPVVRWRKRGLAGDLGAGYFADVVRGGMHVCTLRVTRHVLSRVHREQPVAEWRAAILEQGETTIGLGSFETLRAAKDAAEERLAADLRAAAEKLGRVEGRYGKVAP